MYPNDLTRRDFLKLAGAVGAAVGFSSPLILPGCVPGSPAALLSSAGPSTTPARVVAVRGRDLSEMTRQAIAGLGGMSKVVNPGETVFIKPNFLTAGLSRPNHTVTGEIAKPEIAVATAEECLKAGAGKVIIGDGAQVTSFSWQELVTLDGSTNLAAEAARLNAAYGNRLQLACLNSDSPDWDPLPTKRSGLRQIYASSLITRADKIISIPVLKTHHIVHVTGSLKNLMGVPPISIYGGGTEAVGRYRLHYVPGGPPSSFLDMADTLRPHLASLDASLGVEGQGPWARPDAGSTVDMRERLGDWLVLASTDPLALDATEARIIGQDYTNIPYMASAYQQGLGQAREDLITLDGATMDELRVPWQPAQIVS